jgi:hypothetical protein
MVIFSPGAASVGAHYNAAVKLAIWLRGAGSSLEVSLISSRK